MRAARILHNLASALWWAPTLVSIIFGCIVDEIQAHVRIARASRLYTRAQQLVEAGHLDQAQALLDRGDALLELAKPKPRDPT